MDSDALPAANVIVLTTGLSGSSALTGLLAQAGYWTGEKTVIKDNSTGQYDTYENSRLVELNQRILQQSGVTADQDFWYLQGLRDKFIQQQGPDQQLEKEIGLFMDECNLHTPWIWKDPVLWQTLGFWLKYLDASQLHIIVLNRRSFPLWVSQTSKRIIYDFAELKTRETNARSELIDFLGQKGLNYLEIEFDSLVASPSSVIHQLNEFLCIQLNVDDWNCIYRNPMTFLENIRRNMLAILIYLKNYRHRIRLR